MRSRPDRGVCSLPSSLPRASESLPVTSMVAYGLFTSRKERNRQRYRSDKFYRGTFTVILMVIVAQAFLAAAASALLTAEKRIDPETRTLELRLTRLESEEEQYGALLRKLKTVASLKPLIENRIPATKLVSNIEEAFLANEQVGLVELKLSNHFDLNDPNSKDDFTILITGAIKATSLIPTVILTDFTKTLGEKLPQAANVEISRNAVVQGADAFAPFEVRIHYTGP